MEDFLSENHLRRSEGWASHCQEGSLEFLGSAEGFEELLRGALWTF
jgi:hypothetical protein